MRRVSFLFFLALALVPSVVWAQGNPLGPQFRVNTYTPQSQNYPSVAVDSTGNFVVVWESYYQDGSDFGVFGQRYASSGGPVGPEFRVNTYTTERQLNASVAVDSTGNFVVVWESRGQEGNAFSPGVFGQRYDSAGAPLGPEFRVNTYTTNAQSGPTVASDASGAFVVVWTSGSGQDGSSWGVFGQRYDSAGAPLGPEFRVNTYTTGTQGGRSVAGDPSGNFIVVWSSYGQDGSSYGVFGQRYASSGAPLGPEFRINTYTTERQAGSLVAADSTGNFVVVWSSRAQDGSNYGVFGQRYANSGAPLGPEFRVNTYTTGFQSARSVAADSTGNFVVVWNSYLQDGSSYGVFGQRYASSGDPLGPEFRVNTFTTGFQRFTSVAANSSGNFIVVWESDDLVEESPFNIFGQRYSPIVAVDLPPIANAGPDQTVPEGTVVTLDGSGSSDPNGDPLTYLWEQIAGPTVTLSDPTAAVTSFTAPDVAAGGATLSFRLTVSDGALTSDDTVDITVTNVNQAPVAHAGDDQTVPEGSAVTLHGGASFDPDNDPLTYAWTQTAGTAVSLSDPSAVEPSFTAPLTGPAGETLVFTLTVSDGVAQSTDDVAVVVTNVIDDFAISAQPPSQTVPKGQSTSYTVTVTPSGGFNGVVTFGVSGLPNHATATFNPATVTGSGSSTMTVATKNGTPKGTFTLTISGTSGAVTHATTVTLVVIK
jgi:hypothetical protein